MIYTLSFLNHNKNRVSENMLVDIVLVKAKLTTNN